MALCLINYTDLDVKIQNYFFDFTNQNWLIDRDEPVKKFIFYELPKIIFGIALFGFLVAVILGFKKKSQFLFQNRHKFLLILLGMILISLLAGNIKKFTNIYCPNQLAIYGGDYAYTKIFEKNPNLNLAELRRVAENPNYKPEIKEIKPGQCFPAGHSVTGFALLILFFVFEKKRNRFLGLFAALTLGWTFGNYQMLKGVHFFGDTLVSMLICFLLAAILARLYPIFICKKSQKN